MYSIIFSLLFLLVCRGLKLISRVLLLLYRNLLFYGHNQDAEDPGFTWDEARKKQCLYSDYAVLTSEEALDSVKAIVKRPNWDYFTAWNDFTAEGNSSYFIMWVGGAKNPSMKKDAWNWLTGEDIPQNSSAWHPLYPKENGDCLAFCTDKNNRQVSGLCNLPCTTKLYHQMCQARGTIQKMKD